MPRRFSEQDAQRIFARVAEKQRAASPAAEGLSLEDLEEAARAAGLDPALVAGAAMDLDSRSPAGKTLLSAPVEVTTSRVIDADLDDETWARIVRSARDDLGATGIAGQIGDLREWTVISGGTKNGVSTRLAAEPTGEGTRITLTQSFREAVLAFIITTPIFGIMSVIFAALAAFGVEPDLWIPAVLFGALASTFFGAVQLGSRAYKKRREAGFDRILDRLELAATSAGRERPSRRTQRTKESAHHEPEVDLDALEDEPDVGSGERRRVRN